LSEAGAPTGEFARDPPALRRRRKVLFGAAQVAQRTPFEAVPPRQQFSASILEPSGDLVFNRLADLGGINHLRKRADEIQYGKDGYLDENAIELLELGLATGTPLSKRLFQVAQAQKVEGAGPRRPLMTCFELLALSSVLRAGEDAELVELLYCIFDVDADDKLSVEDLTVSIDAFLGIQDAAEKLENKEDREDFANMDFQLRHKEARRLAELAIKDYGVVENSDDEVGAAEEKVSEAEEKEDGELEDAAAPKPSALAKEQDRRKQKKAGSSVGEDSDSDEKGSKDSSSSTKAAAEGKAKAKAKPKRRGGGLCGGKNLPRDADSDAEDEKEKEADKMKEGVEDDDSDDDEEDLATGEAKPKRAPKPAKKKPLCGAAPPASDGSSESEAATLKAASKPKPKPKPKAKRSKGGLCGSSAKRKVPRALGFEQWRKWLAASQFLPAGFAGLSSELEAKAADSDSEDDLRPSKRPPPLPAKVPAVAGAGVGGLGAGPMQRSGSMGVARRAPAADGDSDESD